MGVGITSLLFGIGAAAWIYNKMMRSTGNNTQSSLIAAGVAGAALSLFFYLVLTTIESMIS